jgi:plastocyanin
MKKVRVSKKEAHTNHVLWITLILITIFGVGFLYNNKVTLFGAEGMQASNANEKKQRHADYEEPAGEKKTVLIEVTLDGFKPQVLRVKANRDVVAFKNSDSVVHNVVADDMGKGIGMFRTGDIRPGEQVSAVEYTEPGTYTYHLDSNPNEKGTIIVEK